MLIFSSRSSTLLSSFRLHSGQSRPQVRDMAVPSPPSDLHCPSFQDASSVGVFHSSLVMVTIWNCFCSLSLCRVKHSPLISPSKSHREGPRIAITKHCEPLHGVFGGQWVSSLSLFAKAGLQARHISNASHIQYVLCIIPKVWILNALVCVPQDS
jgi:hypothetical protein